MFYEFRSPSSLRNPKLHTLVMQVRQLAPNNSYYDFEANSKTIIHLIQKILAIAKSEKEWPLYIDALHEILYLETEFGSCLNTVKYADIFFRDCDAYLTTNRILQIPNSILNSIVHCYDDIFDAFRYFYQINDKKMEIFWQHFHNAVDILGNHIFYWRCRLDYALLLYDEEEIALAAQQFFRYQNQTQEFKYFCYACYTLPVIGYYIYHQNIKEIEAAIQHVLSRNVPSTAYWMYDLCPRSTSRVLYSQTLRYSLRLRRPDVYAHFLLHYLEAFRATYHEGGTYTSFHYAAANDYSRIAKDLAYAAEDAEECYTVPTYSAMECMLCWMAYFRKLAARGVTAVRFDCKVTEDFPQPNQKGLRDVQALWVWYEAKADQLGAQFSSSRALFSYADTKSSYLQCCGL